MSFGVGSLIDAVGIVGVAVFAVSGALAAGRHRMDPVGFVLLGTVTAIGGGSIRDVLLGRPVFWAEAPEQLLLAAGVAIATYFLVPGSVARRRWLEWSDAAGLAAFAVQGSAVALTLAVHPAVAVVMGVLTATGGGVVRDLLAGDRPLVCAGEPYASTAFAGALTSVALAGWGASHDVAAMAGFVVVLLTRGATIVFRIQVGPPGEFLRVGGRDE